MEILIKAKQSNNPQFEFLNRNSRLNNFYKHMLQCMKNGTYPEDSIPTSSADNSAENTEEQNASNDPYTVPTNYPMVKLFEYMFHKILSNVKYFRSKCLH